ncbi:anaerobic glycerol-3-phosphate dehydrogenase subunit A [Endozoicomonas sp. Mp262]|uniref:anaerobic glycerol-3-phosphate dehydrogenase subunit A n=1 Tax=Endozoicomonas sp. Mp262 TaxID=2919499 RepID=UPI0021DA0EFF
MKTLETDVVIIGGGATGAGVLRDCSLRGIRAILIEKDDIATGATGRNHGLLHSGGRYAVTDAHSAKECIQENKILKKVARHCIEETGGLFITLPEDDVSFQKTFIEACNTSGIETELLSSQQALKLEPNVNPRLLGAVKVPDGTIDPFRLTASNILDAEEHGGQLLNYTRVQGLIVENGRVCGIHATHIKTGERIAVRAQQVVNAAGIWGQQIAEYADLSIHMIPSKGSLLIMDYRINSMVLNRCRKPADADILVPGDTISLIGTTSQKIPYGEIDNLKIDPEEVDILIREGEKLAPVMSRSRILRAYAGVRPLVALGDSTGRNISRGIVLMDHADNDGLPGLVTITGGKLMTYRLMAEKATDAVAKHLGNSTPCCTAEVPLPGACGEQADIQTPTLSAPVSVSAKYRHGERAAMFLSENEEKNAIVCECEMVTRGEIEYAVEKLNAPDLVDLRRRTRLGMGPCQGELCACRAAGIIQDLIPTEPQQPLNSIGEFLEERWKGNQPVLWGDALREAEFSHWIYESLLGYSSLQKATEPLDINLAQPAITQSPVKEKPAA